jgi:chromosome segregation ATPase
MAEGSETGGGGPGADPPGGGMGAGSRRGEGDLLAERRARRAMESAEHLLTRRAEAAEATVRTLEAHVGSLQQRLREAEEERTRVSELIAAERASSAEGPGSQAPPGGAETDPAGGPVEHELRLARQHEYAEQRQRAEAEERLAELELANEAELEQLRRRLSDSESEAGMLASRLERLRRELAEAEHSVAAERAVLRRAEAELQARLAELEARADAAERELDAERAARERAERTLALVRSGQRKLEALVAELKAALRRLRDALGSQADAGEPSAERVSAREPLVGVPAQAEDTGAAEPPAPLATEAATGPAPAADHETGQPRQRSRTAAGTVHNGEMVDALAVAVERLRARASEGAQPTPGPPARPPLHKHSMSLIARARRARKQRRQR